MEFILGRWSDANFALEVGRGADLTDSAVFQREGGRFVDGNPLHCCLLASNRWRILEIMFGGGGGNSGQLWGGFFVVWPGVRNRMEIR